MGANVSQSVSNVSNKISQELQQNANASASAQCSVKTGDIILNNAKRCSVTNENRCIADSSAALDAISKAAAESLSMASNEQKTVLIPGVNVNNTSQSMATEIRNILKQRCQSNAALAQEIAAGNIIINGCEDSNIYNTNAGSASANCGIKTIMDTINKASTTQNSKQTTGDLFGGTSGLVIGMIVAMVVIILLVGAYLYISTKKPPSRDAYY